MDTRIREAIRAHDIQWRDIDRIEVQSPTYEELVSNSNLDVTDMRTGLSPSIRRTLGEERIIYTEATGDPIIVPLE